MARRITIAGSFDPRNNSLNFLRLGLALLVVESHVFLGGFRDPLLMKNTNVGNEAVFGFFAISGFLIASSASHNSLGRYLWQRFLRIFPAFWLCLGVTAFIFGVVAWTYTARASSPHCGFASCYLRSPSGPFQYVYRNALLVIRQPRIANTPPGVNWPTYPWNGSLWTLSYEFFCYLLLAGLALVGLLRHRLAVAILTGCVWVSEAIVGIVNPGMTGNEWSVLVLAPIFLTGSLLYLYRDRVPDSGYLALGLAFVFVVSPWLPFGGIVLPFSRTINAPQVLAPLLAYPLLWLGIHLPFRKVGARNDYSYGVYIYAFPVQLLLAMWGVQRWGYFAYLLLSIVATIPCAVASWWIVEKHALRLKKLDPKAVSNWIFGAKREATS